MDAKRHVPYAGAAAAAGLYPYGVPKPVGKEVTRSNSILHLLNPKLTHVSAFV